MRSFEEWERSKVVTDYLAGKDVPELEILAACRRFSNRMFKEARRRRTEAVGKYRAKKSSSSS